MSEETIPQMRETIDRITGERNTALKQVTKLEADLHVRDAREAFRTGGYDPRHGDLFASHNPDTEISAENVATFADEWNLGAVDSQKSSTEEGDQTVQVDDGSEALAGMTGGGTTSGDGGSDGATNEKMTRSDWQKLMMSDPAAAKEAAVSGRVKISGDNPWLGSDRDRTPSGTNPYVTLAEPVE